MISTEFSFDLRGQLNNIRFTKQKAMWPLFEAIVNSIQAIEDSKNKDEGLIIINAIRESLCQMDMFDEKKKGRISSFKIIDNGIGMNNSNYQSFRTAYSTFKITKGCKGIGRLLWLKAFSCVYIESSYKENNEFRYRNFTFSENGITEANEEKKFDSDDIGTSVYLSNIFNIYQDEIPVSLDLLAKRIVEHLLPFFIVGNCPMIQLKDNDETYILNQIFERDYKPNLKKDEFTIEEELFTIYHLKIYQNVDSHRLYLCANNQEVESLDLSKKIPNLSRKIEDETGNTFYYAGYVVSKYLDSHVNSSRTSIEFDEDEKEKTPLFGIGKDNLVEKTIQYINENLKEFFSAIDEAKRKRINEYVMNNSPAYKYMLKVKPSICDEIPAGLSDGDLELELHKHKRDLDAEVIKKGEEIKKEIEKMDEPEYDQLLHKYLSLLNDSTKSSLADYMSHRKTVIELLKKYTSIQPDGSFKKERMIHSLICPMQKTSDEIPYDDLNLWVINENLVYNKFLASDKSISSMPLDSSSRKEPDILGIDTACAYVQDDLTCNNITIVEFKKPGNDSKSAIDQVIDYIKEIKEGKRKNKDGKTISVTEATFFYCYIICDLSPKIVGDCRKYSYTKTADGEGFYGFNNCYNAYIEVISYNKLILDAERRHNTFFKKLFG